MRMLELIWCLLFQCTSSCDGGLQHRNAQCVDLYDDIIPDSQCSSQIKKLTQLCNKESCPSWEQDDWTQVCKKCVRFL